MLRKESLSSRGRKLPRRNEILVWNLCGNAKNAGNQGGDVENRGGNLRLAVEMKQESNGIDKIKEWREVKIIENK